MGNRNQTATALDSTGSDDVPVIELPDDPDGHLAAAQHPFDAAERVLATAS